MIFAFSKKNNSGVTLTELLVSILLIGIVAGIAIPSYRNIIVSNRISTVVSTLHSALLLSRSEAIKHGKLVNICRSSNAHTPNPKCDTKLSSPLNNAGWGDGWIIYVDVDRDKKYSNVDILVRVQEKLFENKEQGSIMPNPNKNQITFNPLGQTYGNYIRFAINRPDDDPIAEHDKYICIASGGRVRVDPLLCQ